MTAPPLSVYVHLPWCVRKCPYCDFNSHALRGALPEGAYLRALLADLGQELEGAAGRPVASVFFGGGTPSLFSARSVARVLESIDRHASLEDVEITLEANPGAIERGRFADYACAGVNRISLGAQSFEPERLTALGRVHSVDEIWRALDEMSAAGIDNFNIDLMYGLPGQTLPGAMADLDEALRAGPTHLSYYQLTIEPNTLFHRRPPALPDARVVAGIESGAMTRLDSAGYRRYEVSAWARSGRRCRHNENYWRYGDYLGIGAGAHGKLTDAARATIERCRKPRHPRDYMTAGAHRAADRWSVPGAERLFEFMLNALRLVDGFTESLFTERTGLAMAVVRGRLESARAAGLLECSADGHWRASPRGLLFLNDLQARFLPAAARH